MQRRFARGRQIAAKHRPNRQRSELFTHHQRVAKLLLQLRPGHDASLRQTGQSQAANSKNRETHGLKSYSVKPKSEN